MLGKIPLQTYILPYLYRNVRKRYFVNVDMENEDEFRPKYVDFLTDLMFTRCTDKVRENRKQ